MVRAMITVLGAWGTPRASKGLDNLILAIAEADTGR